MGWFDNGLFGQQQPQQGGGLLGATQKPNTWDTVGLIASGLQDANAGYRGERGGYANAALGEFEARGQQQHQQAINKAIQDAYATGDMNKVRQVLVQAAASGADISHITKAMEIGQPKIQDVGGAGYSIDPFTSKATQIIPQAAKRPMVTGGMISTDEGKTWNQIPGYIDSISGVANARAAATAAHRAPPKATAATGGTMKPWQRFGGQ